MASLLDSVTVTRVFSLPIAASISSNSAAPSVSGRRISPVKFLEFRGLKVSRSLVTQSASLGSNRRLRVARGGRIACEAQDTTAAVEGIYLNFILLLVLFSHGLCGSVVLTNFCVKLSFFFVIANYVE